MMYFLIGKPLGHSFSADYFNRKFHEEDIDALYVPEELVTIGELPGLLERYGDGWQGFNVTAPYKQEVIPFLDSMTDVARDAGSVNCVRREKDGSLTGHNTDVEGFGSLLRNNAPWDLAGRRALLIGGGGVGGAVLAALSAEGIGAKVMTRDPDKFRERYPAYKSEILMLDRQAKDAILETDIIINCTPLGMFPDVRSAPSIPYEYIQPRHLCLDLVYNPADTLFTRICSAHGATAVSGLEMLVGQAEAAWRFWNIHD